MTPAGAARWARSTGAPWLKLGLLLVALATPGVQATAPTAWQLGRSLFLGQQPLPGQMPGAPNALPANASRCINCHAAPGLRPTGAGAGFGPALNAAWLMQLQPRRGGPASRYDAASLCRLLREGVDPAGVVLPAAMPRYRVDDAQCRQLWALLTSDL
jgi:hypothetical protein